jgi:hypothetical protein
MQRARGWVWFAVIGGMLAWSLRTIPPSPPVSVAAVAALAEAPLPLANRLRPQPLDFSPDLRGRPTERGPILDLLASSQATPEPSNKRALLELTLLVTHVWSAAGALPYFPTGPPPIA